MHLLAATPGGIDDGSEAIDLEQDPADIVILTAADTEIACFSVAQARRLAQDPGAPSVRCANLLHLGHNYSVDLYLENTVSHAKLVVARLLGGRGYWSYGVDELTALCRMKGIALALVPGDDHPDAELHGLSTMPADAVHRFWQFCAQGGTDNAEHALAYAATLLGHDAAWREPAPLLRAGIYWPKMTLPDLSDLPRTEDRPVAGIVFYRALYQAANTAVIDALIAALEAAGVDALPVYVSSLKDPVVAQTVTNLFDAGSVDIVLNGTGFALSVPGAERTPTPFDSRDCPVLQVVFSGGNETGWAQNTRGLSARDIAMNVALPEVDGRLLSRAVSFKDCARRDILTQADVVGYAPIPDRCAFVAQMAAAWCRLRQTREAERRIAIVFANYPNRDARLGNGVGLDTPAGTLAMLRDLAARGYTVGAAFDTADALIAHLKMGPTNAAVEGREIRETLSLQAYQTFFDTLPAAVREAVLKRWGRPQEDPFFRSDQMAFALPVFLRGGMAIGLQPARGYNINPQETYHSPDLVPPHGYIAFYAWIRGPFDAHAVIHMGKHGNLEWLPGKAVALSQTCFPEAIFGPMPHIYPFIVNDPGEGTQAKRRTQAAIVDHLTPPLTRAESYGPLKDLELLVDEYFEAAGTDPRRIKVLRQDILDLTQRIGLAKDCGIDAADDSDAALAKLDNYLCELKEMQIRDGLHIFGESPHGRQRTDLLVALSRVPRGRGQGRDASLIRALAEDLDLSANFDPLSCDMAEPWTGMRPATLADLSPDPWRSQGDTVERLERLAVRLVQEGLSAPGERSAAVLRWIMEDIAPKIDGSGPAELMGIARALNGRFLPPGPSGAPTRGRPDVLPTGRNFYSVDTRTVPTPAAWTLGWKSAQLLVETYAQEHGDYPTRLALSCWGTANMRTGGDDIAQALALMGVCPQWDSASRRVTGFEIMPADLLDRPRVDVTLRISGFFRDAFPGIIDLVDSASRAVAALDEPSDINPLASAHARETEDFIAAGMDPTLAARRAGTRIFGSKPGAYGAGLQALIDERGWQTEADLADAYLSWGSYAYGSGAEGIPDRDGFERRLGGVQAILHNQDNREHDVLDSDDYYQFEGGMAVAARSLQGGPVPVYHNDHSRPEDPKIRSLEAEIGRVVRARVVNPKWIQGVMRHGYKGAFEMAATVDYLFAFSATAKAVSDHHFDAVFEAYLMDDDVRAFLENANPDALKDIALRLAEAQARGLWTSRRNDTGPVLAALGADV